jgi:hypothetical protein
MRGQCRKLLLTLLLGFSVYSCVWALPLPKSLLTARFASADKGSTCSFSDSAGKTWVVLVAGRKSYPAAYEQAVLLTKEWASNEKVAAFVVADLAGVPGFVRGAAEDALLMSHRNANGRLPAGTRIVSMLDWDGLFAKQLDIVGESNDGYLLYVVDRRGQIVLRLTQGVNDITEEQLFRVTVSAVQKAQGR